MTPQLDLIYRGRHIGSEGYTVLVAWMSSDLMKLRASKLTIPPAITLHFVRTSHTIARLKYQVRVINALLFWRLG
jgi:hypothetical protein